MKKLVLFLSFFPIIVFAQEVRIHEYQKFRIGFEAGYGSLSGNTVTPDAVRQNQSYYYEEYDYNDYYYSGYIYDYHRTSHYYFGVKPEFSIFSIFSVAAGIRFVGSNSKLNSDKDYFLWKVSENGLMTNYVRVKDIEEKGFYIGIPVEMTFYTNKKDIMVRHYVKGGVSINLSLSTKTTVNFENSTMKKHTNKVMSDIEKKKPFTPIGFVGSGIKIGRMNNPFGSVEFRIPFSTGFSSFVDFAFGAEIQAAFYIPMGEKKLSYTY